MWVNQEALGELADISVDRVRQELRKWRKAKVVRQRGSGKKLQFYAPDYLREREADAERRSQPKPTDEYDQRFKVARALKAEHELQVARGERISVEEAMEVFTDILDGIKSDLACLPPEHRAAMSKKIQARIEIANGNEHA